MNIRKIIRLSARTVAVATITLSIIVSSSTYTVANADSLSNLKNEYAQLQQEQQQLQQQLNNLNAKVVKESSKKAALDKSVGVIKKQIKVMDTAVTAMKTKLKKKNHEIAYTKKQIKADTEQYKNRVRTIYETGNTSELELLLSSTDFTNFITRYNTLKVIEDHDTALISDLNDSKQKLSTEKAVLQQDLIGLQNSEGTLAAKQQVLRSQLAQQASVVKKLKKNANAITQKSSDVNEKARETDAQINAEIAKEAAARKRQLEANTSAAQSDTSTGSVSSSGSVSTNYLVNYARGFIGIAYVYGSADPKYGFDCSGLVQYVYANAAGIPLPHSAADQANYGTSVSKDDLQPGDLVFFATDGGSYISHVGIYSGNGMFIEANSSSSGYCVMETGLFSSGYWASRYMGARRLLS